MPVSLNAASIAVTPSNNITYTVIGTNSLGCSNSLTLNLAVNANPTISTVASASAICVNSSATLTASGVQNYTWMPGNLSTASVVVNPTVSTTYTIRGTNSVGCESFTNIALVVNANPTLSLSASSNTLCAGSSASLSALGAQNYTWNPSALIGSLVTVSPSITTVYTLVARDANACSANGTLQVVVNANPTLQIVSSQSAICVGANASYTVSGASNYTWNPGALISNSISVSPTANIVYTVNGLSSLGCSDSKTVSLQVNANPSLNVSSSSTAICNGASASLTANGAINYSWTPNAATGSLVSVSPTVNTIYTVSGTNANACSDTKTIALMVNANPTVSSVQSSTAICIGQTATLSASGANNYTWNPGAQTASLVTVNPTINTTYTVLGINASGCTSTKTLNVQVNALPSLTASAASTAICFGGSVSLNAAGAQTYTWNPGVISGSLISVSPTVSTVYTLSATNNNGCSDNATVSLVVNALPNFTLSVPLATVCANTTASLSASGANTYTWNPGNINSANITPTISGNTVFTLQGTSAQGCQASTTVAIYLNNCPGTINDSLSTIENTPVFGDASLNDNGTNGGVYTGGSPSGGAGSFSINPSNGQYTFTPNSGFTGITTVTYTLCNGSPLVCSTSQITFTVYPTLSAVPDLIITSPGVNVSGTLSSNDAGVVSNANYSVTIIQPSAGAGTLSINPANGQYTFVPASGFTGTATANYTICNISVNPIVCSSASISLLVANIPVAVNDMTTTMQNVPVVGDASLNDMGTQLSQGPVFIATLLTANAGTLNMDASTGSYTFNPASGFTGTASANYTLCNLSTAPCATANIDLVVYPNLVAVADIIYGQPNTVVSGTLTNNDLGILAGANYSVIVTALSNSEGTIVVNAASGEYTFTPAASFSGSTSTTYTICNLSVNPMYCSNTTIQFLIGKPQMAATKNVIAHKKLNANTFQTVFEFNLSNIGNAIANNVQLVDNLNNAFPSPITYTVAGLNANNGLDVNNLYNGSSLVALLSGTNSLMPAQNAVVTLSVNYNPNGNSLTQLSNMAIASSAYLPDPNGNAVHNSIDTTNVGSNNDPNGNGNPNENGENNPTTFGQQIAISKTALPSTSVAKGVSQTAFILNIENIGVVKATNIEVIDNLMATFPSPITFTVVDVKSGALLTLNSAYDGKSIVNLLAANNALNTGAKESITLTVNYSMNGSSNNGLFNTATAITKDNLGHQLSIDISQNGSNCDPNGNGNPNENGENEVTYFAPANDIDSVEVEFSIPQGFSPNGDGVNDLFVIRGISKYPNNELSIFNRWGNVVYKMKGYDNTWNGKASEGIHYGSDDLPEGTYFFVFDLGNGKIHKGYIYLNRAVK